MTALTPFELRMQEAGMPSLAIRTFAHYYTKLVAGEKGWIPEAELQPLETLPNAETFTDTLADTGRAALGKTVLIKLNGGLGTSMGMERAKSLLTVKDGLSFLDITARQALYAGVPLILMNSFRTRTDTLKALAPYRDLSGKLPLDFVQHRSPKVLVEGLSPAEWPPDPELAWAPPGHGDLYTALITSGLLQKLLDGGYEYAFLSNIDNLGAVPDPAILGHMVRQEHDFLMEAADRTSADRKGGHLAADKEGNLLLRESAQTPAEDVDAFQNIERHRYFNTNNLWLSLPALDRLMQAHDGVLGLPMIRNRKTLDPRDPASPSVFQLETAMGQALSRFKRAGAVRVPRTRFAPVKSTNDLLAVRSDLYTLKEDYSLGLNLDESADLPVIDLDGRYFGLIDEWERRFRDGPPSLASCRRFVVRGDHRFGAGVVCTGVVELVNDLDEAVEIPAGEHLHGD